MEKIQNFGSLKNLDVVIELPHTFTRGFHELQLGYVLPFYQLSFTKWTLKYHVPNMGRPDRVSKEDIAELYGLYVNALKHAKDDENRIMEAEGSILSFLGGPL